MKGTPEQPDPNRQGDRIPIRITFDEASRREVVPTTQEAETEIRRFRITIPMLEKYGFTDDCEGCRFKRAGMSESRAHSERCRQRLIDMIRDDPEDKRVLERQADRIRRPDTTDEDIGMEGRTHPDKNKKKNKKQHNRWRSTHRAEQMEKSKTWSRG